MISPHKRFIRASDGQPSRYDLLEHIAQKAVALKFGLEIGFCHLPAVVNYDLRILHAENIQLCEDLKDGSRRAAWRATLPEPLDVLLDPWTVQESYINFVQAYHALVVQSAPQVTVRRIEAMLELVPRQGTTPVDGVAAELSRGVRAFHSAGRQASDDWEAQVVKARAVEMTDAEKEEQRRCFAHGNVAMSNPNVTREMVDSAAERLNEIVAEAIKPNKEET